MAEKKAVASGLWSSTSTWDGGTLPLSTDDVFANNFTVSIDQTITVNRLRKVASTGITAGGGFVVTAAATVNITAGIVAADNDINSTDLLLIDAGSAAVTVNAPSITGGAGSGRKAIATDSDFTGALTINANLTGGTAGNADAFENRGDPTSLTITGNLQGGTGSNAAVDATGSLGGGSVGTLTINGSITGGSTSGHGLSIGSSSVVSATITGNVTGGASSTFGINNTSSNAVISVLGDVSGGTANDAYGIYMSLGALTVRGNVRPGSHSGGAYGIWASQITRFRVSGAIWAGGVSGTPGPNGWFPIQGAWTVIDGEDLDLHMFNDAAFPSSNAGDPVIFTEGGGGGTIPESGVLWPPRYWG